MTSLKKIDLFLTFDEFLSKEHEGTQVTDIYKNIIELFSQSSSKSIFSEIAKKNKINNLLASRSSSPPITGENIYDQANSNIITSQTYYNTAFTGLSFDINQLGTMPSPFLYCITTDSHCTCLTIIRQTESMPIDDRMNLYTVIYTNTGKGVEYHMFDDKYNMPGKGFTSTAFHDITREQIKNLFDVAITFKKTSEAKMEHLYFFIVNSLIPYANINYDKSYDDQSGSGTDKITKVIGNYQYTGDCGFRAPLTAWFNIIIYLIAKSMTSTSIPDQDTQIMIQFKILLKDYADMSNPNKLFNDFDTYINSIGLVSINTALSEFKRIYDTNNSIIPEQAIFDAILEKMRTYSKNSDYVELSTATYTDSMNKFYELMSATSLRHTEIKIDPTLILDSTTNGPVNKDFVKSISFTFDPVRLTNMDIIIQFEDIIKKKTFTLDNLIDLYDKIKMPNSDTEKDSTEYHIVELFLARAPLIVILGTGGYTGKSDIYINNLIIKYHKVWDNICTNYKHIYDFAWVYIFYKLFSPVLNITYPATIQIYSKIIADETNHIYTPNYRHIIGPQQSSCTDFGTPIFDFLTQVNNLTLTSHDYIDIVNLETKLTEITFWPITQDGIDGLLSVFYDKYPHEQKSPSDITHLNDIRKFLLFSSNNYAADVGSSTEFVQQIEGHNKVVSALRDMQISSANPPIRIVFDYNILFAWVDHHIVLKQNPARGRSNLQNCMFFMNLVYKCKYSAYCGSITPLDGYTCKFHTNKNVSTNFINIFVEKKYIPLCDTVFSPTDAYIYDQSVMKAKQKSTTEIMTLFNFIKYIESKDKHYLTLNNTVSPYLKYGYKVSSYPINDVISTTSAITPNNLKDKICLSGLGMHTSYRELLISSNADKIQSFIVGLNKMVFDNKKTFTRIIYQLYALCNNTSNDAIKKIFNTYLESLESDVVEKIVYNVDDIDALQDVNSKLIAIYVRLIILLSSNKILKSESDAQISNYAEKMNDIKILYNAMRKYIKIIDNKIILVENKKWPLTTDIYTVMTNHIIVNGSFKTIEWNTYDNIFNYARLHNIAETTLTDNIIPSYTYIPTQYESTSLIYSDLLGLLVRNVSRFGVAAKNQFIEECNTVVTKHAVTTTDSYHTPHNIYKVGDSGIISYYPLRLSEIWQTNLYQQMHHDLTKINTDTKEVDLYCQKFGDKLIEVYDDTQQFLIPNITTNPYLLSEFKWVAYTNETNRASPPYYVGTRHPKAEKLHNKINFKMLAHEDKIYRIPNDVIISSKGDIDICKTLMGSWPVLNTHFPQPIEKQFEHLESKLFILLWKDQSTNKLVHIDFLSCGISLTVDSDKGLLFINGEYQIVDSSDWMIQQWSAQSHNTLLTQSKTGSYVLATFTSKYKTYKTPYGDGLSYLNIPYKKPVGSCDIGVYFTELNPMTKLPIIPTTINDDSSKNKLCALINDYINAYATTNLLEILYMANKIPEFSGDELCKNYEGIFHEIVTDKRDEDIQVKKFWTKIPREKLNRSEITKITKMLKDSSHRILKNVCTELINTSLYNQYTFYDVDKASSDSIDSASITLTRYAVDSHFINLLLSIYSFINTPLTSRSACDFESLTTSLSGTTSGLTVDKLYQFTINNNRPSYISKHNGFRVQTPENIQQSLLKQIIKKWTTPPLSSGTHGYIPEYITNYKDNIKYNTKILSVFYTLFELCGVPVKYVFPDNPPGTDLKSHSYIPDYKCNPHPHIQTFNFTFAGITKYDPLNTDIVSQAKSMYDINPTTLNANRDTVIKNYLFSQSNNDTYAYAPVLIEYYSQSLFMSTTLNDTKNRNDAFMWYFRQLIDNYVTVKIPKEPDLRNDLMNIMVKYDKDTDYDNNLLEFIFQFISGQFARSEQLKFVTDVTHDILKKSTTGTSYTYDPDLLFSASPIVPFDNPMMFFGSEQQTGSAFTNNSNLESLDPGAVSDDPSAPGTFRGCGRIHNMLMGGGKTSTITPLTILRYIRNVLSDTRTQYGPKIYLVLPEQLVRDSYEALKKIIGTYFPIDVKLIREGRINKKPQSNLTEYTSSLNQENHTTTVYIMNDITMKCGFLNNYTDIMNNSNKNVYLFDEIDTILNPTTSELNFPDDTKESLKDYNVFFEYVYTTLTKIFKNYEDHIQDTLDNHESSYTNVPHFNIVNASDIPLFEKIQNFALDQVNIYYNDTIIRNYVSATDRTNYLESVKNILSDIQIQILYNLLTFINDALPTALVFINRKNYGIGNGKLGDNNMRAIPFKSAEQPSEGSEFNSPILTIVLTILAYILNKYSLPHFALDDLVKKTIKNYNNIPRRHNETLLGRALLSIFETTKKVEDFINTNDYRRMDKDILAKFVQNDEIIKQYCKALCGELQISSTQKSVSGIDLIMQFNNKYKSGFTGTPRMPRFYDHNQDTMGIVKLDNNTVIKINTAMDEANVIVLGNDSQRKLLREAIDQTHEDNKSSYCGVLIDIGALLVGITPREIYNTIKDFEPYKTNLRKFIYWNSDDIVLCIDEHGVEKPWDRQQSQQGTYDSFYYYDNQHIVGTDAKIPSDYRGLGLIGKTSRYRDVVQGMFRMRKLTNGQKITFVVPEKVAKYIYNKLSEYQTASPEVLKAINDQLFPDTKSMSGGGEYYETMTYQTLAQTIEEQMVNITHLHKKLSFINKTSPSTLSLFDNFTKLLCKDNNIKRPSLNIANILGSSIVNYFADLNIDTIPDNKLQHLADALQKVVINDDHISLHDFHNVPDGPIGEFKRSISYVTGQDPFDMCCLLGNTMYNISNKYAPFGFPYLHTLLSGNDDVYENSFVDNIHDMKSSFRTPIDKDYIKHILGKISTDIKAIPEYTTFKMLSTALHNKKTGKYVHSVAIINFCKQWANINMYYNNRTILPDDKKSSYYNNRLGTVANSIDFKKEFCDFIAGNTNWSIMLAEIQKSASTGNLDIFDDSKTLEIIPNDLTDVNKAHKFSQILRKYGDALYNLQTGYISGKAERKFNDIDFSGLSLNMKNLRIWFEIEETETIDKQQQAMKLHNARALIRLQVYNASVIRTAHFAQNTVKKRIDTKDPFLSNNTFMYPKQDNITANVAYLTSSLEAIKDEMNDISLFTTNNNPVIDPTIMFQLNLDNNIQITGGNVQRVTVSVAQKTNAVISHNRTLNTISNLVFKNNIDEYTDNNNADDYYNSFDDKYKSLKTIRIANNVSTQSDIVPDNFMEPYFVMVNIGSGTYIFNIISAFEGLKILDTILHNPSATTSGDVYIFDALGNFYMQNSGALDKSYLIYSAIIQFTNKLRYPYRYIPAISYKTLFTEVSDKQLKDDIQKIAETIVSQPPPYDKIDQFFKEFNANPELHKILMKCLAYDKSKYPDMICALYIEETIRTSRLTDTEKDLIKNILLIISDDPDCDPVTMTGGGHINTRIIKLANRLFVF